MQRTADRGMRYHAGFAAFATGAAAILPAMISHSIPVPELPNSGTKFQKGRLSTSESRGNDDEKTSQI